MVPIGGYAALPALAFAVPAGGVSVGARDLRHGDKEFRPHEGGFLQTDRHAHGQVADLAYAHQRIGGTRWTAVGKAELRDGAQIGVAGLVGNGFSRLEKAKRAATSAGTRAARASAAPAPPASGPRRRRPGGAPSGTG